MTEWTPWSILFWWHKKRGHTIDVERIPAYNARRQAITTDLVTCNCGKRWMPW